MEKSWMREIRKTGENHQTTIALNIADSSLSDLHRKKGFTSFPSPAGMSLTKLPLGRNNSVMTSLFPPRESLVVTSRLGTGNPRTFFLRFIVESVTKKARGEEQWWANLDQTPNDLDKTIFRDLSPTPLP